MESDSTKSSNQDRRVDRILSALKQEYVIVGKTRLRAWHAWLLIGIAAGIAVGVILIANHSGEVEQGRAATERNSLIDQMVSQRGSVYIGAHNQDNGRERFEDMIGRNVALTSTGFDTDCHDSGTEGTRPSIDIACREARFQNGYLTTYAIETIVRNEDDPNARVITGKITPQLVIDGEIDPDLREVARAIVDFDKPVLWLYHREPLLQFGGYGTDGTWPRPLCESYPSECNLTNMFGDPAKEDGPERYVAVMRHIHDIVEGEIAATGHESKIIWIMGALSSQELMQPGLYTAWYPGSAYVNWHAFNWYPLEIMGKSIRKYESLSLTPGWHEAMALASEKPVLILEFGVSANQGDRSWWFTKFFSDVRTNPAMKNFVGFLYWQEAGQNQGGEDIRTSVPNTKAEAAVWRQEVKKHQNIWKSVFP